MAMKPSPGGVSGKFRVPAPGACWALALVALLAPHAVRADDPWADAVVSHNAIDPNPGFNTPEKMLGEPTGGGTLTPNNSGLHSIGRPGAAPGSYVLLKFNTPVTDDPLNPMGLDFIVYGNSTWAGGNPLRKWAEPGLVEISEDVNGNGVPDDPWYVIPGSRGLNRSVLPGGISNPSPALAGTVFNTNTDGKERDWGYCDMTPTQRKYLDNYVRPDDPFTVGLTPRSGGGDAFDIKWAVPVDGTGNPDGISRFHFIRISAFINMADGTFGYVTPEIDAVADVAPDVDTDGDGILDEYETRVAGTDPLRPESTVLALEIPPEDGDSPAGKKLGTAKDARGNAITLHSSGLRSGVRDYNCLVDILPVTDPAPGAAIAGKEKSGAVRRFDSSVPDFQAGQVQDAELTIAYTGMEIAGLDEAGLQPYRFDGAAFTQEGISSVTKDTKKNLLTFRSRYSGVFLLASTAGAGDQDTEAIPVTLTASPTSGVAGAPGTEITVQSGVILLAGGAPVPNGTQFTVSSTLGAVTSPDANPTLSGVQVAAVGGRISFTLRCGTVAGTATVAAASLDGTASGALAVPVSAGPAAGPVELFILNPQPKAPGPVDFTTGPVRDAFGNLLDQNTRVTVAVRGGRVLAPGDASPAEAGHQIALRGGAANFSVRVDAGDAGSTARLEVFLYADPEETELVAAETWLLEVADLPLRGAVPLAMLLALAAAWRLRRRAA